jgi:signal transduction histidine kinase
VEGFTKRSGIQVDLDLDDVDRLPGPMEIALFRIVQESLTNVHRHAASSTASIHLTSTAHAVTLEVQDRGGGLRDSVRQGTRAVPPGTLGVGIQGMRERIRQLGGTFDISFTDAGTTVRVRVPLHERVT